MSVDDYLHRFSGAYVAAPQWVKSLAGGAYSLAPRSIRFGRPYDEFKALFERPVSAGDIEQRLARTLSLALTQVPAFAAYRSLAGQAASNPFEVLRQLREQPALQRIPVVAVSANAMPDDLEDARRAGFADYLTKPVDMQRLLAVVDRALGGSSAGSAAQVLKDKRT